MGVKIRQKDGKWYVFINHKGQRKARCVGDSKRAAEDVKRKLEAQLTLGDVGILTPDPQQMTFADYAQHWLTTYGSVAYKPSSQRPVTGIVTTHLLPAFGAWDLREITRGQVRTFLLQQHQRYAPTYVKAMLRTLHTILAAAVDEERLSSNPASRLRVVPETRGARREIDPFSSRELAQYLQAMQAHYPQYYPYFLCLARTGIREGEALGLWWDDVQLGQDATDPHRFLHVRRTYDPVHRMFTSPKNGRSRRVDMSWELRETLVALRTQRFDTAVLRGTMTIPDVVFCGAHGHPLSPSWLSKIHKRVCAAAHLRGIRVHDLRHSYATIQLYEHHAPIQYVSEQLGHASIKITVDTYGHPRQGTSIALADRLDASAVDTHHSATWAQLVPG